MWSCTPGRWAHLLHTTRVLRSLGPVTPPLGAQRGTAGRLSASVPRPKAAATCQGGAAAAGRCSRRQRHRRTPLGSAGWV